jgi:hypothetical protein
MTTSARQNALDRQEIGNQLRPGDLTHLANCAVHEAYPCRNLAESAPESLASMVNRKVLD